MAQKRYVERGRSYDYAAWRTFHRYITSPGVYYGFDLSVSLVSGSNVNASSGGLMLPTGLAVVEDTAFEIDLTTAGNFPPSAATNYTIYTEHDELSYGMIGGDAMTYNCQSGILTEQPSNGAILGWIRHPGGGVALDATHIYSAPKQRPLELAQTMAARQPISLSPPNLVLVPTDSSVVSSEGYDTINHVVWRGAVNNHASLTKTANHWYLQWPVYSEPYQIRLRDIIPSGGVDLITITVYDTAHVAASTPVTLINNSNWTWNSIPILSGKTWTVDSMAIIDFNFNISVGSNIKIANLIVDNWPYGLSRVG